MKDSSETRQQIILKRMQRLKELKVQHSAYAESGEIDAVTICDIGKKINDLEKKIEEDYIKYIGPLPD